MIGGEWIMCARKELQKLNTGGGNECNFRVGATRAVLAFWFGLAAPLLFEAAEARAADATDPNAIEQAKSILADQIRDQGYACDRAEEAHRDEALSKPDEPVWTLRCGNAVYRVRLRGGMAAEVEVLDTQP
jgi:hypothetical protein